MTDGIHPPRRPELDLERARALLLAHGAPDTVALIGVRGFFGAMGSSPGNDSGIYDDAVFLVDPDTCRGFVFNTDPMRFEPPNVTLMPGLWRYLPGQHVSPGTLRGYDALVHAGHPVWVRLHPRTEEHYRYFADKVGLPGRASLRGVPAYQAALIARGGRVAPDGAVEWQMREHINIHRGSADSTSSLGCQTVEPGMWQEFIDAVYGALRSRHRPEIPYLLVDAADLEASRDG